MSTNKRTVEVFTAGCPVCRETLDLVRQTVAGCGCEVVEDGVKANLTARPPSTTASSHYLQSWLTGRSLSRDDRRRNRRVNCSRRRS